MFDCDIKDINLKLYFLKYNNDNITKYIIDNIIDLEHESDDGLKLKTIHYICANSTPKMIKYIIDKGVNLECEDVNKMRPIHYICLRRSKLITCRRPTQSPGLDMTKYIIDKGVNLECETINGNRPIHLMCRYSTPEIIKYIIDKGVNLECEDIHQSRPINWICKYSTMSETSGKEVDVELDHNRLEIIKYMIDKKVSINHKNHCNASLLHDLCRLSVFEIIKCIIEGGAEHECKDIYGWTPLHISCHYNSYNTINYMIDQGWDINIKIKKYNGTPKKYGCIDLLELNKKLRGSEKNKLIYKLIHLKNKN
jgi:ankyrin repeat protein